MCPHNATCVSSYTYVCVLKLLYVWPRSATCLSSYVLRKLQTLQLLIQQVPLADLLAGMLYLCFTYAIPSMLYLCFTYAMRQR